MNWGDFEAAAPELARLGRERFLRTHVALLGTLRRDGSPRISPVEPYFVLGHLLFGVMRSVKASDLERDPRCTIHSSVSDPNGSEGEFKLYGKARPGADSAVRDGDYEAWWQSYPAEAAHVFALEIDSAAYVSWNFETMTFEVTRWSPATGVTKRSAAYP